MTEFELNRRNLEWALADGMITWEEFLRRMCQLLEKERSKGEAA